MSSGPSPLWDDVQQSILLAEFARMIDETIDQCMDQLGQIDGEFGGELKRDGARLLKCSLWAQSHLEYSGAKLAGFGSAKMAANGPLVELLNEIAKHLSNFVVGANNALQVVAVQSLTTSESIPADECGRRMGEVARLAREARMELARLKVGSTKLKDSTAEEVTRVRERWPLPPVA
jgi:hypothetical protein